MASASNRDRLLDLFQTVVGRPPAGSPSLPAQRAAHAERLASGFIPTPPTISIPDVLTGFLDAFGGERAVTATYYHIYSLEHLIAGMGHLIFAADARSGVYYGISRYMLPFDDPDVVAAAMRDRDDVFAWGDHSESLDDCLVEFAGRNLCEAMGYDLFVPDATRPRVRAEFGGYTPLPLTKSGGGRPPAEIYYAPGTVILHDSVNHTVAIGLDSLPRALAFQAKHDWGFDEVFEAD